MNIRLKAETNLLYIAIGCANNELQQIPLQILNLIHSGWNVENIHIDKNLENYQYEGMTIHKIKKYISDCDELSWEDLNFFINNNLKLNSKLLILVEDYTGQHFGNYPYRFIDPSRIQLGFVPGHNYTCFPPLENPDFTFILSDDFKFIKFDEMSQEDLLLIYDKNNPVHRFHLSILLENKKSIFNNTYSYDYRNNINKIPLYEFLIWWEKLKPILGPLDLELKESYRSIINNRLDQFIIHN